MIKTGYDTKRDIGQNVLIFQPLTLDIKGKRLLKENDKELRAMWN